MTGTFLYGANIHANGIRQHYLRYGGEGAPLILIPGITSPAITWGFVGERLGRHFDTYILDVRGRGLSESGPHLGYGLDECASDVLAFADALNLSGFVLLGHSMGARIAIRTARATKSRVSKAVLVDPPVTGPGRRSYPTTWAWFQDSLDAAQRGIGPDEMRKFVPSWEEKHIRLRAEWLHTCDMRAVAETYRGFHEDDIHADIPKLTIPVLLMVAGKGGVILPDDVKEIKTLLPSIQVERVENASHLIPWDDFDGFFRALGPFLGADLNV
jgi:N-formylmaleamate deformylase